MTLAVAPVSLIAVGHRVEHGQVQILLATAAGRNATNHFGAVLDAVLGVKRALLPGEALADDLGVLVDKNAHDYP